MKKQLVGLGMTALLFAGVTNAGAALMVPPSTVHLENGTSYLDINGDGLQI